MSDPSPPRWTPERQCLFLSHLARRRCVEAAARAAGMSRESAHRLRRREAGGLFDLLWTDILATPPVRVTDWQFRRDPREGSF
ncbi:LysR family transcriptional regulator [Sphingomonas sp. KRR8]|uniref:LysR family transcriptional regulator n=1 Tax=Sphingomonas sp. KRR8 TaxID=2942996 RepID=UPI0020213BCA|nr:LysR family transcriptional regulator [Sphingomonas sp. KRR8]URD60269.1 LysR family transcriptional regulator [Sphingomonas sp. KRR8]